MTSIAGTLHDDLCTFMTMRNISYKHCTENQNTYFTFKKFFPELCRLWNSVEKYVTGGQATDGSIVRCMCFVSWINTATDTNSEYVILTAFHGNNGYENAPQYYVIRTLPVVSSQKRNDMEQRALHTDEVLSEVWGFGRVEEVFALLGFFTDSIFLAIWQPTKAKAPWGS